MKVRTLLLLIFSVCNLAVHAQPTNDGNKPLSFLQVGDAQTMPSTIMIENSLIALEKDGLTSKHIAVITKAFAFSTIENQNRLLLNIHSKNKKLAESLIIYRKRINQAIAKEKNAQRLIETVFFHYVINTTDGLTVKDSNESQELFEGLRRYANYLGVGFTKNHQGRTEFMVNGKSEYCTNCNETSIERLHDGGITINKMRYGRVDVISSAAYDFNGHTSAYSLENAAVLADFSHLAYFKPAFVENQLKQWGYTSFQWIEGKKTDTQGFLAEKGNYQMISFRGTESIKDIITDVWFRKTNAYGGKGKVHSGFEDAVNEIWESLVKALDKRKNIYISGHSLGGALAQLMAHRLAINNYKVLGVYTFGSPRVGNLKFKNEYDAFLAGKTFLHINNRDIVATVPPEQLGFINLGNMESQFDDIHNITVKNTKGSIINAYEELDYEQLDVASKEALKSQMAEVATSIRASSAFLRVPSHQLNANAYSPVARFETGKLDDHGMGEYLFKLACAMVEREWKRVEKSR